MKIKLTGKRTVSESGASLFVLTDNPKNWFIENIVKYYVSRDSDYYKWEDVKIEISIPDSKKIQ